MTREEAKKFLTGISYMSIEYLSEKDGEKMREAIALLAQQPCEDCISRQDAYKCLEIHGDYDTLNKVYERLKKSPSVNPQKSKTEPRYCDRNICLRNEYNGIGCDECEVTKSGDDYKYIKSISKPTGIEFDEEQEQLDFVQPHKSIPVKLKVIEPCEDAISRQAVMDALCNDCELFRNGEQTCFTKCEEYHFLATLPPVNSQPKTGHWIKYGKLYQCSECEELSCCQGKFCNECGARMVEPTCDTCEYTTAAFNPCNACKDKSEYKPQESEE